MDPQMLIAMIELDKVAKQCSRKDGTTAKHVELCKTSELAALIRKFPDLHNHFVIKFVDRPSNRAQTGLARRSPTPHPSRKSSSSARRANSRDKATRSSSRTRRSSSRTRVTSKGRRSTSRHSDGGQRWKIERSRSRAWIRTRCRKRSRQESQVCERALLTSAPSH